MIIEIEHDWYESSGNSYEGVPTTFEIDSQVILGDDGYATIDYTATLLYTYFNHCRFYREEAEMGLGGIKAVEQAEAAAEEYCAEGFTE
jgi:hypothetical protein